MARCGRSECGRWRPGALVRVAGMGLYLDDRWFCSVSCLEREARVRIEHTAPAVPITLRAVSQPKLGTVLTKQKRIPTAVVRRALSQQPRSGLKLGSQLIKLGVVSTFDVLRALAAQGGVGFLTTIDPARLGSAPGNLSTDAVRALRLVPFEADARQQVMKVACMAPVPRVALGALRHLTGWIVEPYLVADDQWPALAQAYGMTRTLDPPKALTINDIEAAAAHVAAVARSRTGLRMIETRCEELVCVRLEREDFVEELWLRELGEAASTGEACEAEPDEGEAEPVEREQKSDALPRVGARSATSRHRDRELQGETARESTPGRVSASGPQKRRVGSTTARPPDGPESGGLAAWPRHTRPRPVALGRERIWLGASTLR